MKAFGAIRSSCKRSGFTLIELLVAAAILVLLTALLLQILDSSSRVIGQNRSRFFAETRAQAVLGLFDQEIQSGIFRRDLAAFPGGKFELYSQRPGAGTNGNRAVSPIGYRLNPSNSALERASVAVAWAANSANAFSFGLTNTNSTNSLFPGTPAWREVASGVVALQTTFINRDGTSTSTNFSNNRTNLTQGILLTVATIDERTEKELIESGRMEDLMNDALWRAVPPGNQTYAQYWEQEILKDSFRTGKSARAVSNLRIAERYVPIPR